MEPTEINRKRTRDETEGENMYFYEGYSDLMTSQENYNDYNISSQSSSETNMTQSDTNFRINKVSSFTNNKKMQHERIHSEIHQKTVSMMMEASRKLSQMAPIEEPPNSELTSTVETFTQRPYW